MTCRARKWAITKSTRRCLLRRSASNCFTTLLLCTWRINAKEVIRRRPAVKSRVQQRKCTSKRALAMLVWVPSEVQFAVAVDTPTLASRVPIIIDCLARRFRQLPEWLLLQKLHLARWLSLTKSKWIPQRQSCWHLL